MKSMKSINRVILNGSLAATPLFQKTSRGKPFACLRVKTQEKVKKGDHEHLRANYHAIMVFAEILVEKLSEAREGDIIFLEGRIHNRKIPNGEGKTQYIPQIILDEGGKIELFSPSNKVLQGKNKNLSKGALKEEEGLYA